MGSPASYSGDGGDEDRLDEPVLISRSDGNDGPDALVPPSPSASGGAGGVKSHSMTRLSSETLTK